MEYSDVIGQERVKSRLTSMFEQHRLPHALMFCGPTGCGKMALSIALATQVIRESATSFDHKSQMLIEKLEHPDLHFTYPTIKLPTMGSGYTPISDDFVPQWRKMVIKRPYFSMEEWMENMGGENQQAIITVAESDNIAHKLNFKASQGGWKVSIIWLPERMNIECANKMLKLIEEPPPLTLIIMASQEPQNLPETILSRVQQINIKRIEDHDIIQALISQRGIDRTEARYIARTVDGNWTKALQTLEAESEDKAFFQLFTQLMRMAYKRDVRGLKKWSNDISTTGREKQKRFLLYFLRMIRECYIKNFNALELNYMSIDEDNFAGRFAKFITEKNVTKLFELGNNALRDIAQSANGKIVFFDIALQTTILLMNR